MPEAVHDDTKGGPTHVPLAAVISLSDLLHTIHQRIQVPEAIEHALAFTTGADPYGQESTDRLALRARGAFQEAQAATILSELLCNADGAPDWYEWRQIGRPLRTESARGDALRLLAILTRGFDQLSAAREAGAYPLKFSTAQSAELRRAETIGFLREKVASFLDLHSIPHSIEFAPTEDGKLQPRPGDARSGIKPEIAEGQMVADAKASAASPNNVDDYVTRIARSIRASRSPIAGLIICALQKSANPRSPKSVRAQLVAIVKDQKPADIRYEEGDSLSIPHGEGRWRPYTLVALTKFLKRHGQSLGP